MTDVDFFIPVAAQPSVETFERFATSAEAAGYDRVWLPESWGRNAVSVLTRIAHETEDIGIGTSVTNVYSRSPALVGQTAVTLQEVSDGRFRMGLGTSGPILIEGWHGRDFGNPLRHIRETLEIARTVTTGERLEYDGEIYSLSGFRLRCDPPDEPVPFDAAGMGPKAVELAGRFADGWHALMLTPEGLAERLGDFDRGSDLGDRDRSSQRVTLAINACALEDGERARTLARQHLAFYIGGMGTFYADALARQGYEDVAEAVVTNWANGDHEAATAAIPDELLEALGPVGTPAEAREQVAEFKEIEGVDALNVGVPRGASPDQVETTIDALAPE
jgi:coenzyme F420-dependent oxidoreductase